MHWNLAGQKPKAKTMNHKRAYLPYRKRLFLQFDCLIRTLFYSRMELGQMMIKVGQFIRKKSYNTKNKTDIFVLRIIFNSNEFR